MSFTAYEGNEPYIFISYAHKDSVKVLPILEALSQKGFRIWYDAGIEAGTEWPEYIAEHLKNCHVFLAFISKASVASKHCRQEITYAISKGNTFLTVYLEDVKLPDGLEMQLCDTQAMFYERFSSQSIFVDTLAKARELQSCKGVAPSKAVLGVSRPSQFVPSKPSQTLPKEPKAEPLDQYDMAYPDRKTMPDRVAHDLLMETYQLAKEKKYRQEYSILKKLVASNSFSTPSAYYLIGCAYHRGRGVAANREEAIRFYTLAAKYSGDYRPVEALKELGAPIPQRAERPKVTETPLKENETPAQLDHYDKANPGRKTMSSRKAGDLMEKAIKLHAKNKYDKAFAIYMELAESNSDYTVMAYREIAFYYREGFVGPRNKEQAVRFYRLGAKYGDKASMKMLDQLNITY